MFNQSLVCFGWMYFLTRKESMFVFICGATTITSQLASQLEGELVDRTGENCQDLIDTMPLQTQTQNVHCVMFKDDLFKDDMTYNIFTHGILTLINAKALNVLVLNCCLFVGTLHQCSGKTPCCIDVTVILQEEQSHRVQLHVEVMWLISLFGLDLLLARVLYARHSR